MITNNPPNFDDPQPRPEVDDTPLLRRLTGDGIEPWWLVPAAIAAGAACGLVILAFLARAAIDAGAGKAAVELARTVTVPVEDYLNAHASGLPFSAEALMTGWYVAGGALLLLSGLVAVRGARIGWVLFGIATAAMVYAAAPRPGRWIAVGIAAAWWTLLSMPALSRRTDDCSHRILVRADDQPTDDRV